MISARERKYVLFDDVPVKWFWSESELMRFREMWNDGEHIQDIAKAFRTNKRSIALLIMDQAENNKIKQRKRGLVGKGKKSAKSNESSCD